MEGNADDGTAAAEDFNADALAAHRARQAEQNAVAPRASSECEECGLQIAPKRLEAIPTATMCIECAEFEAARKKHYAYG